MRLWKQGLVFALLCFVINLEAKENIPESSLNLEVGQDSEGGREAYLDLDAGLASGLHIRWLSGGTQLDGDTKAFETRSRLIGVSSDYSAPLVAGFEYDYWGNPDTIETRTRRFKLGANTDNWYIQLVYEDRVTRLRTNGSLVTRRGILIDLSDTVDIDSIGRGLEVSFYGAFPFTVNVSYIEYDYNKNIAAFAQYPEYILLLFPPTTINMATGLEAWRRSGDINYSFSWGALGLSGSQNESAVDGSLASTGAIYLIWDIRHDWSATFTWEASGTDNSDETVRFGRVAITHRW